MTVLLAVAAGYLAARLLWTLLRRALAQPALLRSNWRGESVPTGVGILLALTVIVVEAGRVVAGAAGIGTPGVPGHRLAVVLVVLGMALVGLLDDLAGGDDARGFRGHLAQLGRGRLTTGGAKLLGGLAVAAVAVAVLDAQSSSARLAADAALVALAANLGNLFDRRPGRATKAALVSFVALVAATSATSALAGAAVAVGAAAALLLDDLRERIMLGDTGANALGGAVGLGVVAACAPSTRSTVLAVLVGLNLASEVLSFGRVIDGVPPLRALDRWGRRAT